MPRLDRCLRLAVYGLAFSLILLSFIGGWLHYTPVPFWDMWDGTIVHLMAQDARPYGGLFDQHNEHRIVLSRLLFWMDYSVFAGRHLFLIAFNFACAAVAWLVFWRCLREINARSVFERDLKLVGMVLGAWLFMWAQKGNFTWAFQSQFHLAQLLPLLAFLALSRSARDEPHSTRYFALAVLLGCLSAGTMANGVLALPLMAVWSVVLRMKPTQTVILSIAAATIFGTYLSDYSSPSHHSTVLASALSDPIGVLVFTFKYLANPFAHVIGPYPPASWVVIALGAWLTSFAIYRTAFMVLARPEPSPSTGLLLFIIYVGASAFLTAGGRLTISEYAWFADRYATPALYAWAAAFCLLSPWVFRLFYTSILAKRQILTFAVLGLVAMYVPVFRTLLPVPNYHHNQAIAVLALELGIKDENQIRHTYPHVERALMIAERASSTDFGIFGHDRYKGLKETIGTRWAPKIANPCSDHELDDPLPVEDGSHVSRLTGHVSIVRGNSNNSRVYLLDESDRIIGAGLTQRPNITSASSDTRTRTAAFTAYVPTDALAQPLWIASKACR